MTIEIRDKRAQQTLAELMRVRPGTPVEEVIHAAIAVLKMHDEETDRALDAFAPGELQRLIEEGETSDEPADGDVALAARKRKRAAG